MHSAIARIVEQGSVRFDQFQADALYGADGFYATGGAAGKGGDFVTAVETSSEFGACIARALDEQWRARGRPDPFVVVEGGAGVGTLCADVFAATPECVIALKWVMVETSEAQRVAAMVRLASETFADVDELPVAAIADIGQMRLAHPANVVLSNELLDNLPVRVVRQGDQWEELFIAIAERGLVGASTETVEEASELADVVLVERWQPLGPETIRRAEAYGNGVERGVEFPLVDHAVQWVVQALGLLADGGIMLAFDYGAPTVELADRGRNGWMRTYAHHGRGLSPLENLGGQDITCDVPFDQLPGSPSFSLQADWLEQHGLGKQSGASGQPLSADERALTDTRGMGSFTVATWNA